MPDLSHPLALDRRSALAALGATGLGAFFASASAQPGGVRQGGGAARGERRDADDMAALAPELLGWNDQRGEYVLPPLPYGYDDLEPHIDAQTMRHHHDVHHQGYVNGLNTALRNLRNVQMGQEDPALVEKFANDLSFNAGGHINHTLFWNFMSPSGGGEPGGDLARQIEADFGSFNQFVALFQQTATSVKGSGWGWLIYEPVAGRLMVTQMHNQEDNLFACAVPLLGVDVWEHAYYLKYGPRRADYVQAFMNVVNWGYVAQRFDIARRGFEFPAGPEGRRPRGRSVDVDPPNAFRPTQEQRQR